MRLMSLGVVIALLVAPGEALADDVVVRKGQTMWSAFECSAYAEYSNNPNEGQRLFAFGLESGREFLQAIQEKRITWGQISKNLSWSQSWELATFMGSPSIDFILGRIFSSASDSVIDEIVKTDENGKAISNPSLWVTSKAIMSLKASYLYRQRNCSLLK